MYLGETCSESTAGESASKGDVGFGTATSHHCFDEAKKCSQQMKRESSKSYRKQKGKKEKKNRGFRENNGVQPTTS